MSKISIIIPIYNGLSYTKKCLKILYELKEKSATIKPNFIVHIIIVDDGSTDGTADWIIQNYPDVNILSGDGKLWWSGSINKGVSYALESIESDYILWWNNDIIPQDDYFVKLLEILENHPTDVVIGSKIFILNDNIIWGMGGKFDPNNGAKFMYGEHAPDNDIFTNPIEVDWFPGMGTTMHRKVFEKIGFLDEKRFPQYHGDCDFTYRAKKAGFKLIAFPQLKLFNDNSNTGIKHQGSLFNLYRSLKGIKSIYNVKKDIQFLRKHSKSIKAYIPLINKYFRYVGGFLKWSFLNFIGIKK